MENSRGINISLLITSNRDILAHGHIHPPHHIPTPYLSLLLLLQYSSLPLFLIVEIGGKSSFSP